MNTSEISRFRRSTNPKLLHKTNRTIAKSFNLSSKKIHKKKFLRVVAATDQDDGRWILCKPLVYKSDVAKRMITVPAGFQTDLLPCRVYQWCTC
jgi:hypothetical protein